MELGLTALAVDVVAGAAATHAVMVDLQKGWSVKQLFHLVEYNTAVCMEGMPKLFLFLPNFLTAWAERIQLGNEDGGSFVNQA
jgi:hypothetical protein